MKYPVIGFLFVMILLAGCNGNTKKAQAQLDAAVAMYERGEYAAAKIEIDSLRKLYPKEFEVLKAGLLLMRQVEKKETERNLAFCDSLLPVRRQDLLVAVRNFDFEKDTAYNAIGTYIHKQLVIERNLQRSYIRSGVNEKGELFIASVFYGGKSLNHTGIKLTASDNRVAETPAVPYDGGLNYRFTDMGQTTEVVTYQGGACADAIRLIYDNPKTRIKVEYTGGKPYTLYLSEAEKKAIVSTYELAAILSDIEILRKEKEKAQKKILYIERKLSAESHPAEES